MQTAQIILILLISFVLSFSQVLAANKNSRPFQYTVTISNPFPYEGGAATMISPLGCQKIFLFFIITPELFIAIKNQKTARNFYLLSET